MIFNQARKINSLAPKMGNYGESDERISKHLRYANLFKALLTSRMESENTYFSSWTCTADQSLGGGASR